MITPATLEKLKALRREHCGCEFEGNTPEFHAIECPYVPLAIALIRAEEKEAPHEQETPDIMRSL